jgi:osmotically-inducible protein OsmY
MNDREIIRTVRRTLALLLDDLDSVRVEVEGGIVYLEGVASNALHKQAITQRLGRVPGVRQVINCLSLEHVAALPPMGPMVSPLGPYLS